MLRFLTNCLKRVSGKLCCAPRNTLGQRVRENVTRCTRLRSIGATPNDPLSFTFISLSSRFNCCYQHLCHRQASRTVNTCASLTNLTCQSKDNNYNIFTLHILSCVRYDVHAINFSEKQSYKVFYLMGIV